MPADLNQIWTLTLSSKGQICIPAPVRKRLALRQGSILRVLHTASSVVLTPVRGLSQEERKDVAKALRERKRK